MISRYFSAEKLDHEYTKLRKEMMLKRSELFKMFSENLNHLQSPADKKSAVLALKEGLKKIKESKPSPESVASGMYFDFTKVLKRSVVPRYFMDFRKTRKK